MKTIFIKNFASLLKISAFLLLLFFSFEVHAQIDPEEQDPVTDTIKGYNTGKIEIKDPPSIVSAYTYDPVTDRYILN